MALQLPRRRFTTEEYHRMAEAGVLSEDDRVELIDGDILEMSPIGNRHAACVKRLAQLLIQKVGGNAATVGVQDPVQLGEHSEPQPDLSILRLRPDFYRSAHPGPEDVLLLIEVADTSVEYDKQVKVPFYAQHGIPETWLADLERDLLIVYLDPTPTGYQTVRVLRRGETVTPSAFPHLEIPVEDILG